MGGKINHKSHHACQKNCTQIAFHFRTKCFDSVPLYFQNMFIAKVDKLNQEVTAFQNGSAKIHNLRE